MLRQFNVVLCCLQLVMSNLQSILENVDTPELLCQSVTCILQVARCYPHIFSINFRVSQSPPDRRPRENDVTI